MRDVVNCEPEEALNFVANIEELRNQYQEYLQSQNEEDDDNLLVRAKSLSLDVFDFSDSPSKLTDQELENLKNIFQAHNISKITFENGKLTIEYDRKEKTVNNSEFEELEKYCREHNKNRIDRQELGISSTGNKTSTNSSPNKNNYHLVIGLAMGVGATILVGIVVYFARKRENK